MPVRNNRKEAGSADYWGEDDPCAGADWNAVWRVRHLRHQSSEGFLDSLHVWDREENAERYDRIARSEYSRRVGETLAGLPLNPTSRVLDIGAGPGTLAIPLAPLVREITTVEPAAGMTRVLRRKLEEDGIGNVQVVPRTWEDVDPGRDLSGPYDLVIASLSLSMPDIREAVEKMVSVCSGSVHIFWFADPPFWERSYLATWPALHGVPFSPGPKADCLYMVLCQMGIYPDVEMRVLDKRYRFASRDEMYGHFRFRFGVENPDQEQVMRKYLDGVAEEEGGSLTISGDSRYAWIHWEPGAARSGALAK
ncbi:16S rRNA G527 N7-methylase RsmG [Methanolinea mesophila]|uniref:class I SAM-dependent methyltransferase n=1 Tax=Methanolinea mesophila TaxID=547055 RepID=UPI001AE53F9C|nr:class I SAM-dependent methyltransferase [Methanolinea mesophila]MBP1928848.1 16S rRNA G527 N7-methylase RsmG [Methanolinea mesophila]